jgi:FkbM family methyltransferase
MRAAGTDCHVISFEALSFHQDCLEELKNTDPLYDYRILALSSTSTQLELLTPTVNSVPLFGVSSANGQTLKSNEDAELGIPFLGPLFTEADNYEVRLLRSLVPAMPLDLFWTKQQLGVDVLPAIAAIKLDVEGHEADVIAGGRSVIDQHRPFFMIEGANRVPEVVGALEQLGYVAAELAGDRIRPTHDLIRGVNGCFFHPDHHEEYTEMGLFAGESKS